MTTNTGASDPFSTYGISTPPSALNPTASVSLEDPQKLLLCSVLDLFAGLPSKRKLTLWNDDASFHDPLVNALGRKQYEAQWYGLKVAFSDISRLSCSTTSAGNPLEMSLTTKYKVKGLGTEQTISSKILVETTGEGPQMRIKKVEDKWGGEIKEGPVKNALRGLNAVTVPAIVSVPGSVEEEERGAA